MSKIIRRRIGHKISKWYESASLIITAKEPECINDFYNYKTLLFRRHDTASFMPNSYVFPGGMREGADESPLWLKHFHNFGIKASELNVFSSVDGVRAPIFTSQSSCSLGREISLRITAIRETFEEVGLLFCRNKESFNSMNPCKYGFLYEDFDREYWQHLVHTDANKFLTLCQELNIVPDLWNLHEWSVWLTPSALKKRFETVFFLVSVGKKPTVVFEKNEVASYLWKSPIGFLKAYEKKKIRLPPPQYYELSRLVNVPEEEELRKFAYERGLKGTTLILPVWYKCSDGTVGLLPGDDMYPDDPNASNKIINTEMSILEFRKGAQKLHRSEFFEQQQKFILHLNFALPNGHLSPVVINRK